MIVVLFIDYDLLGKLWIPTYILTVIALVAVLFTKPINRRHKLVSNRKNKHTTQRNSKDNTNYRASESY